MATKRGSGSSKGHKRPASGKPKAPVARHTKPAKPSGVKAAAKKPAAPAKPAKAPPVKPGTPPGKPGTGRKGITVIENKQAKPKREPKPPTVIPTFGPSLLAPGRPRPKPLIASGPKAPPAGSIPGITKAARGAKRIDKRQVDKYKQILLRKRAELAGDVNTMESEALMGTSGSLSHLPQHMAEQGSDAAGQSLSLDLAAADRRLIKEIDDALGRIAAGKYGVCELTGIAIKPERLDELPWARYSIEAARELERRSRMK